MQDITSAVQDFHRARRQAALEEILARLRGRSVDLLPYDQVRYGLKGAGQQERGLQEIPLESIVGSVGRYADFTRSFLPRFDRDLDRWAKVKVRMEGMSGLPPIDVYKLGETYFIKDGHHRVSVAREMGAQSIQGYVTEIPTRVSITADIDQEELILKMEYADFLEKTGLDRSRPEADLTTTEPGSASLLEEHIRVHRYYMGLEGEREIPIEEAAQHWYDHIYLPVVRSIRRRGVLKEFPDRTEADMYLWVSEHRAALEEAIGWSIDTDRAAADLAVQASRGAGRSLYRLWERLKAGLTPKELEGGPRPGTWRTQEVDQRDSPRLFKTVLVAIRGDPGGWVALDHGLEIARLEEGTLQGLHVIDPNLEGDEDYQEQIRALFQQRCEGQGGGCGLAFEVGTVADWISKRAYWSDLVVVHLQHPPGVRPLERLGSGIRSLLQRSGRPVWAVPSGAAFPQRALLAYDGSSTGREALYVATYLAGRWGLPLTVVTVGEGDRVEAEVLREAVGYLHLRGVDPKAEYLEGNPATKIVEIADRDQCDLIIMGAYTSSPLVEIVVGGDVDEVLRRAGRTVLICQ